MGVFLKYHFMEKFCTFDLLPRAHHIEIADVFSDTVLISQDYGVLRS